MTFPCFADDYQGLSAAVLAATLGAVPDTGIPMNEHRILVLGSGPHRVCIAEMLAFAIAFESRGMASEARQNIYLADDDGIVTLDSPHADSEEDEMREVLLYSKDMPHLTDINMVRSSCICRLSCQAQSCYVHWNAWRNRVYVHRVSMAVILPIC